MPESSNILKNLRWILDLPHALNQALINKYKYQVTKLNFEIMPSEATTSHLALIDGHVHIYDCFELPGLLNAVANNFCTVAKYLGAGDNYTGVLMLTETHRDNKFKECCEYAESGKLIGASSGQQWHFQRFDEDDSALLALDNDDDKAIIMIAGRQIVTSEGLEVLALGRDATYSGGLSLDETLSSVIESGAVPVLPWAVGKWLGRRGQLISSHIEKGSITGLCLGDNGGRPIFWKNIPQFRLAIKKNLKILPGSDPLPIPSEAKRVGSFGFSIKYSDNCMQPAMYIRNALQDVDQVIETYGSLENPVRFMFNQLVLRVKKR